MEQKNLVATIFIRDAKAVASRAEDAKVIGDPVSVAKLFNDNGFDKILLVDLSKDDEEHEKNILMMREINRAIDVKTCAGGNIKRLEDIKKYLYAGCVQVIVNSDLPYARELIDEASKRFGQTKILLWLHKLDFIYKNDDLTTEQVHEIYLPDEKFSTNLSDFTEIPYSHYVEKLDFEGLVELLKDKHIRGVHGSAFYDPRFDAMKLKSALSDRGIKMDNFEAKLKWTDLKKNSDGLVPVVVQDYTTNAVLMMAYMNEEAFEQTLRIGKMTYYSRSRQKLWLKGEESGHLQYVKSLTADCDYDTILAKVSQIGVACHTGAYSCFFNEITKKEYIERNPLRVLENVYNVIADRKEHPKEGSYTNYLFDKGIDKILKKVGEEATEIVIAAKNPEKEEMVYEMSDFLYHAMVLMVERGVTWEDITRELSQR